MKELKKIYELLDDASIAIMVFENSIVFIEEKPFFKLHTANDTSLYFIDCGYDLVNKYNIKNSVDDKDEFIEGVLEPGWIKYTSEEVGLMLEDILFRLDKESRIAVIRKIIRKSEDILYLSDIEFQFISCMLGFVSYGAEERFFEVEGRGRMSFDELSNLIASLVIVSTQFLFHLGTNCIDFGIGSAEQLAKEAFPDEHKEMNFDIFDKKVESAQELESGGISKINRKLKKAAVAKSTEQVDVVRALLKSARVEYNHDTHLAEFIGWLCGGSADSIRKNAIVPNVGFENEDVLKEKFSSIGIEYDKGKIK